LERRDEEDTKRREQRNPTLEANRSSKLEIPHLEFALDQAPPQVSSSSLSSWVPQTSSSVFLSVIPRNQLLKTLPELSFTKLWGKLHFSPQTFLFLSKPFFRTF